MLGRQSLHPERHRHRRVTFQCEKPSARSLQLSGHTGRGQARRVPAPELLGSVGKSPDTVPSPVLVGQESTVSALTRPFYRQGFCPFQRALREIYLLFLIKDLLLGSPDLGPNSAILRSLFLVRTLNPSQDPAPSPQGRAQSECPHIPEEYPQVLAPWGVLISPPC